MSLRPLGRGGFTLAEILIAMMLVAGVALATFPVALTGRSNAARYDRRVAAAMAVQRVGEALKNFVASDTAIVPGPGGASANGWSLPGDSCNCYALTAGHHQLSPALWLPQLASAPYNAALSYEVAAALTSNGPQPTVTFSVTWAEP